MTFTDDERDRPSTSSQPEKSPAQLEREAMQRELQSQGKEMQEHMIEQNTDSGLAELQSQIEGQKQEETDRSAEDPNDGELFSTGTKMRADEEKRQKEDPKKHLTFEDMKQEQQDRKAEQDQADQEYQTEGSA